MSYSINVYLLSLKKLQKALGGQNEKLFEKICKANDAEGFNEPWDDEGLSMYDATHALLFGEPLDPEQASTFGYALEKICEKLGKREDVEQLQETGFQYLNQIPGMQELIESGVPFEIPLPKGNFPSVGHMTLARIQHLLDNRNEAEEDQIADRDVLRGLIQFYELLDFARIKKKDLIAFCY
jgi:hypothetical protein